MKFLNKLFVKAIFSDASELNITAYDLGEAMISASLEDDIVTRLKTATGTVGSLSIIVGVDVTIDLLKTSSAFSEWANRIFKSGWVGGTCTFYDDVNMPYTINDISLNIKDIPAMNGSEPSVQFHVQGNLEVNKDILTLV